MKRAVRRIVGLVALGLGLAAPAGAETWVIDTAHTVSGFTVKHKLGEPASVKADITIETKSAFDLVGDLTIRDVTREVVLKVEGPTAPIRDPHGNRRVGASASTTINRKEFGIAWHRAIETGGVVVGDEVKVNIDIEAIEKKS